MASAIDPTRPGDGVPASKADLRANLQAAKTEIEALQTGLSGKTDLGHGHVIADVDALQAELDGKAGALHSHSLDDIADAGALAALNVVDSAQIAAGAVGPAQLSATSVSPGSYTNTNITVDQQGRLTAASSGAAASAPKKFAATNNSQQTWNSTAFVDVTGWSAVVADGPDFAFNGTVLTCQFAGWVDVSVNLTCEQTSGNNRGQPRMRLERNGAEVNGSRAEGYTRQTSGGSKQNLASRVLVQVAPGDQLKVAVGVDSSSITHRLLTGGCAFTALRIA